MNTKQENFERKCKRNAYKALHIQSDGVDCGLPDDLRPAIQWREMFKMWGLGVPLPNKQNGEPK